MILGISSEVAVSALFSAENAYVWIAVGGVFTVLLVGIIIFFSVRNRHFQDTDPITGGKNKSRFFRDCAKIVRKNPPEKLAMVVLDIDKFKYINERLGYDEGNRVLARIQKTLADCLDKEEPFARISEDNFACLIKNAPDNEIERRLHEIFTEFDRRNSFFIKYPVNFSAGVCRLGQCRGKYDAVDFTMAVDRSKLAKKSIKNKHNSDVAFYDGKIREISLREKDFENAMPQALKNHEFECYLQPKYGTNSCKIVGAEALIRWNSKEFGFVCPGDFIPLAEKNGFVVELDFFILEEVCKMLRRWIENGKSLIVISVNQSRLHINDDDYIWRLREIVDKYEIPYEYIELELTESVFTEDADRMISIMQKLHEIGFKLSIDDFGSGYSSLNLLKDIPADVLKIDREFFNGTVNSKKGRAVISSVVDMAKNLEMNVISEGVETQDQIDFLKEIDCNMVQGFYFSKPMKLKEFDELWEKQS